MIFTTGGHINYIACVKFVLRERTDSDGYRLIAERGGCSPAAFVRLDEFAIVGHRWKVLFALQLTENFVFVFFFRFTRSWFVVDFRRQGIASKCNDFAHSLARRSIRVCRTDSRGLFLLSERVGCKRVCDCVYCISACNYYWKIIIGTPPSEAHTSAMLSGQMR